MERTVVVTAVALLVSTAALAAPPPQTFVAFFPESACREQRPECGPWAEIRVSPVEKDVPEELKDDPAYPKVIIAWHAKPLQIRWDGGARCELLSVETRCGRGLDGAATWTRRDAPKSGERQLAGECWSEEVRFSVKVEACERAEDPKKAEARQRDLRSQQQAAALREKREQFRQRAASLAEAHRRAMGKYRAMQSQRRELAQWLDQVRARHPDWRCRASGPDGLTGLERSFQKACQQLLNTDNAVRRLLGRSSVDAGAAFAPGDPVAAPTAASPAPAADKRGISPELRRRCLDYCTRMERATAEVTELRRSVNDDVEKWALHPRYKPLMQAIIDAGSRFKDECLPHRCDTLR